MTKQEHYMKLARQYADHYQRIKKFDDKEWFEYYQYGIDNPSKMDEFEDYLFDREDAKRKGEF